MKIACTPHVYVKASRPFPKLMVSDNGRIIWAFGQSVLKLEGVLIRSPADGSGSYAQPGYYSTDWHASAFTDWYGTVTLVEQQD